VASDAPAFAVVPATHTTTTLAHVRCAWVFMAVSTSDRLQRLLQPGWGHLHFAHAHGTVAGRLVAHPPSSLSLASSFCSAATAHTHLLLPSSPDLDPAHSGEARQRRRSIRLATWEEAAREEAHPLAPALIGEKQGGATSIRAGAGEEHGRRRPRAYSVVELRQAEHVQRRRATSCGRAELLARRRA
jgi:hypothetical protein